MSGECNDYSLLCLCRQVAINLLSMISSNDIQKSDGDCFMKTVNCTNWDSLIATFIIRIVIIVTCIAFSGCGGGGGTNAGTETAAIQTVGAVADGYFVDAPIAGMAYECGQLRGVTDINGNFRYSAGTPVTFKIGDIIVGTSTGSGILTPINFSANGANVDTPSVVLTVQFLLTIADYDEAGDRLSIPANVAAAAKGKTVDFTAPDAERRVAAVAGQISGRPLVSAEDAKAHLKRSLNKLAVGTYSGTWYAKDSIPDKGAFTVVVADNGSMRGVAMLGNTRIEVTSIMNTILVSGSTYAFTGTGSNGAAWSGTIDLAKKTLSGSALYDGVAATFSARR